MPLNLIYFDPFFLKIILVCAKPVISAKASSMKPDINAS